MLTKEDYQKGLAQIRGIRISIEGDALKIGIDGINTKLAEVYNNQDLVHSLLVEALLNMSEIKAVHLMKKTEYMMEIDRLMAEDPDVKSQKSADARKAQANVRAAQLQLEEHSAKIDLIMAESYNTTVEKTYAHLENAFETLSRQLTALNYQLGLGIKAEDLNGRTQKQGKKLSLKETENDA